MPGVTNSTLIAWNKRMFSLKAALQDAGGAVEAIAHHVVEQEQEVAHEAELVWQLEWAIITFAV